MTTFIGTDQDGKILFTLQDGQIDGDMPAGLNTHIIVKAYTHRRVNGKPVDCFPVMDYIINTI